MISVPKCDRDKWISSARRLGQLDLVQNASQTNFWSLQTVVDNNQLILLTDNVGFNCGLFYGRGGD